jgi:trimeric autotransporter adhesin
MRMPDAGGTSVYHCDMEARRTRGLRARTAIALLPGCCLCAGVAAQCAPQWTNYSGPPLDGSINGIVAWDPDGPGPALSVLVAGGNFVHVGSTLMPLVGAYDGVGWHSLASGVNGTVECVALYAPPGSGVSQPVIGGVFNHDWLFTTVLNGIARFDGAQWQPFGNGVGGTGNATVYCAASYAGGLAIGGNFPTAGTASVLGLARWDGANWSAFADQHAGGPNTLAGLNGILYAGSWWSQYQTAVYRWDDPTWTALGPSTTPTYEVHALAVYQGQLYAGGLFNSPQSHIARFDGTNWQSVGGGTDGTVAALCVFDPDGPGPLPEVLIAAGSFLHAGGVAASEIAAWDGSAWSPLGAGLTGGINSMTVWNNQLVVAGGGMVFWGCPQPAACYPNCDGSSTPPRLNVQDFVCYLQSFVGGCAGPSFCYPNCDGSSGTPFLNVQDFVCFLQKFAQGCP